MISPSFLSSGLSPISLGNESLRNHSSSPWRGSGRTGVGRRVISTSATFSGSPSARAETSADRAAHYRVVFPHLDRLESACLIHRPRAAEMGRVTPFGLVVRIPLDPRSAAGGGVRDHAIEQCR